MKPYFVIILIKPISLNFTINCMRFTTIRNIKIWRRYHVLIESISNIYPKTTNQICFSVRTSNEGDALVKFDLMKLTILNKLIVLIQMKINKNTINVLKNIMLMDAPKLILRKLSKSLKIEEEDLVHSVIEEVIKLRTALIKDEKTEGKYFVTFEVNQKKKLWNKSDINGDIFDHNDTCISRWNWFYYKTFNILLILNLLFEFFYLGKIGP